MTLPPEIADNPALVLGLVGAVLTLAVAFGVHVSPDQQSAVTGLVAAALALLAVWAHKVTVPKTPSATATSASIQTPPPTTPPTPTP